MNIDDVKVEDVAIPDGAWLDHIFSHQFHLMQKYEHIEKGNGLHIPEQPWNVDSRYVQYRIKDMFWRTTEELAEALEDVPPLHCWKDRWDEDHRVRHVFEELADALHFLTEATILAGVSPKELCVNNGMTFWRLRSREVRHGHDVHPTALRVMVAEIVFAMGLAANCLKNKPWKNTAMQTDRSKFKLKLLDVWRKFTDMWCHLDMQPDDVYLLYMRKNAVNQFRQRSNY